MVQRAETTVAPNSWPVGLCIFCGHVRPGEVYTYHYGAPTKGVNPVTLREDFHPLGHGSEFVCDHCVRRSFVRELLHATRLALYAAAGSLISELYRLSSGGLKGDPSPALYAFALSAGLAIVLGVLFRILWKRRFQIESQLFERERERIARKLGRVAASRLQFCDSNFYARNASRDPTTMKGRVPEGAN